ncbi:hypothetical protein SUDANB121_01869 [Nocardiopsis dassonvillei]
MAEATLSRRGPEACAPENTGPGRRPRPHTRPGPVRHRPTKAVSGGSGPVPAQEDGVRRRLSARSRSAHSPPPCSPLAFPPRLGSVPRRPGRETGRTVLSRPMGTGADRPRLGCRVPVPSADARKRPAGRWAGGRRGRDPRRTGGALDGGAGDKKENPPGRNSSAEERQRKPSPRACGARHRQRGRSVPIHPGRTSHPHPKPAPPPSVVIPSPRHPSARRCADPHGRVLRNGTAVTRSRAYSEQRLREGEATGQGAPVERGAPPCSHAGHPPGAVNERVRTLHLHRVRVKV